VKFEAPLVQGRLVRRYKRFLADVELDQGETVTAHCANPGAMLGLQRSGARVLLLRSPNPARKLAWSWELVRVGRTWVGINTARANPVVEEGLRAGAVAELAGFTELRREVRFGERSRVDFLLRFGPDECHVEVKSVTLARGGLARFPDSVTARGARHLRELARIAEQGRGRAVLLYLVHRQDCERVAVAEDIDPDYAEAFRDARRRGVEVLAYGARVGRRGIRVTGRLELAEEP